MAAKKSWKYCVSSSGSDLEEGTIEEDWSSCWLPVYHFHSNMS